MAKVKNVGYTDTAVSGVSSLTFPRAVLNFAADFRKKSEQAGKELVLTNITCPTDRSEKIRIGYSDVQNVYSGTDIEPSLMAPSKRGISVLSQLTETISVTDSVDPNFRIDLPVSYHLVIKVPASEYLVASDIQTGLGRLLSSLFDTGVSTTTRLEAIIRGSLAPSDL